MICLLGKSDNRAIQPRQLLILVTFLLLCIAPLSALGANDPATEGIYGPSASISTSDNSGGKVKSLGAPSLVVPIPSVQFSDIRVTTNGEIKIIDIPWLAEYIQGMFKYAIAISGALAAIMMMIGGFEYLTAFGDAGKVSSGRKRINDALYGMSILFGTFIILNVVNPDLTTLEPISVISANRKTYDFADTSDDAYVSSDAANLDASNPQEPQTGGGGSGSTGGGSSTGGGGTTLSGNYSNDNKTVVKVTAIDNTSRLYDKLSTPALLDRVTAVAAALKEKGCMIGALGGARDGSVQLAGVKSKCVWNENLKTYIKCGAAMGRWGSTIKSESETPSPYVCKYTDPNTPLPPCDLTKLGHLAWDAFAAEEGKPKQTCWKLGCLDHRCQREMTKLMSDTGMCVLMGKDQNKNSGLFETWHFELASGVNSSYCFSNADEIYTNKFGAKPLSEMSKP